MFDAFEYQLPVNAEERASRDFMLHRRYHLTTDYGTEYCIIALPSFGDWYYWISGDRMDADHAVNMTPIWHCGDPQ